VTCWLETCIRASRMYQDVLLRRKMEESQKEKSCWNK